MVQLLIHLMSSPTHPAAHATAIQLQVGFNTTNLNQDGSLRRSGLQYEGQDQSHD